MFVCVCILNREEILRFLTPSLSPNIPDVNHTRQVL